MAGYIFSLDSLRSLSLYTKNGVYATKLSPPGASWRTHHEGTFADYASMQANDNIYFFIRRKIYGIGKLVNVGKDCKYFNYPRATEPKTEQYPNIKRSLLWDEGEMSVSQRCICAFEPDPYFFTTGVDMDDVLSSNPSAFRMLRAFWKLSFIKFDDEENQAFRDIILKRNQAVLPIARVAEKNVVFNSQTTQAHAYISRRLTAGDYQLGSGISAVLASCADDDYLKHEMAIEAGILSQISTKDPDTHAVFGEWDYLSHQVVASPFKPIDYMDKMDLFGYSYIHGFKPTKSRFLVGEVKKDVARQEDVDQLLKYVDWVKDEYCYGDYSMIHAFLVAYDFPESVEAHRRNVGIRQYTIGVRPAQSLEWNNLNLVKYSFNQASGKLDFQLMG